MPPARWVRPSSTRKQSNPTPNVQVIVSSTWVAHIRRPFKHVIGRVSYNQQGPANPTWTCPPNVSAIRRTDSPSHASPRRLGMTTRKAVQAWRTRLGSLWDLPLHQFRTPLHSRSAGRKRRKSTFGTCGSWSPNFWIYHKPRHISFRHRIREIWRLYIQSRNTSSKHWPARPLLWQAAQVALVEQRCFSLTVSKNCLDRWFSYSQGTRKSYWLRSGSCWCQYRRCRFEWIRRQQIRDGTQGVSIVYASSDSLFVIPQQELHPSLSKQTYRRILFVQTDVTVWESVIALFEATVQCFGGVDSVFANAGGAFPDGFLDDEVDEGGKLRAPSMKSIEVNLYGAVYTSKAAIHYFGKESYKQHQLVLTGSAARWVIYPVIFSFQCS